MLQTDKISRMQYVVAVKEWLENHPNAALDEVAAAAIVISEQTKMCFIPDNLD